MNLDAQTIIAAVTRASELVLVVAALAFVRMYFVPEYGFFAFSQREKKTKNCTVRILLFSAEHVAPLDPPVFRVCLRSVEKFEMNSVSVFAGAWLDKNATQLVSTSTGRPLSPWESHTSGVELVLVLRGMAPAGAVKVVFALSTPQSTSGDVPVDVEIYSVSGYPRKGATEVVKERVGLPVRRFDVKSRKFGRTIASLLLGIAVAVATFVVLRLQLIPWLLGREAVSDKLTDLSVWDVGLVVVLLIFALEFALHRLIAGYPFRSSACGYRRESRIWSR